MCCHMAAVSCHRRLALLNSLGGACTMVNSCCAHSCTARDIKETRAAGMKFYRIPITEPKRTLWLNAIGRKDFQPKSHTVICSQHFVGGELYTYIYIYITTSYGHNSFFVSCS